MSYKQIVYIYRYRYRINRKLFLSARPYTLSIKVIRIVWIHFIVIFYWNCLSTNLTFLLFFYKSQQVFSKGRKENDYLLTWIIVFHAQKKVFFSYTDELNCRISFKLVNDFPIIIIITCKNIYFSGSFPIPDCLFCLT